MPCWREAPADRQECLSLPLSSACRDPYHPSHIDTQLSEIQVSGTRFRRGRSFGHIFRRRYE